LGASETIFPFARQIAMSFVLGLLNHSLNIYGGDISVTAMGIAYNVIVLVSMPLQVLHSHLFNYFLIFYLEFLQKKKANFWKLV